MKRLFLVILVFAALATGCNPVYSKKPVGMDPQNLKEDVSNWTGSWINSSGEVFLVKQVDPARGLFQITFLSDHGEVQQSLEVEILQTGGILFINGHDPDHPDDSRFMWARVALRDRQFTLWPANNVRIKELIDKGVLAGTAPKENEITLNELTEEQQKLLAASDPTLFQWDKPIAYFKTSQ